MTRNSRPSLNANEVALIKAMLARGMRNNDIQFRFNTEERPVNSGRISEIKNRDKWVEIEPASSDELDAFLTSQETDGVPDQLPDALNFKTVEDGRIGILPDPPAEAPDANPDQVIVYAELCGKAKELFDVGHNSLGAMYEPMSQFLSVLEPQIVNASITKIWFKGNKLRSILRAHDSSKGQPDGHPMEVDLAYAELLRDVVDTFNIFVLGDPKGNELDQRRLGPQDRISALEELTLVDPIVDSSLEVATEEASEILIEQRNAAEAAPETIDGDQMVALARDTSTNFVIAIIRSGFDSAKKVLGAEFTNAWKQIKVGAYTMSGGLVVLEHELVISYIVRHFESLSAFANRVVTNPAVTQIIDFLSKIFS